MTAQKQPVYPVFLTQVAHVQVVIVGGGRVATRKVKGLLAAQAAHIHVISPALTSQLHTWHTEGRLTWTQRAYAAGDLAGAGLVFVATDVREVNAAVAREAATRGILCNVSDAPAEGAFHVPAVYRSADLVVAVGSGGVDPARSQRVRTQLGAWLETLLQDEKKA